MSFLSKTLCLSAMLVTSIALASEARAGLLFSPDPNWREGEVVFPPYPQAASLRQFPVSGASRNRFFIDADTLSVGTDGVVRFALVIQTPGGAENVTFEGIRCATGERRIYAIGRGERGEWSAARRSDWEPIRDNDYNRPRAALAFDFFCDGSAPPRSAADALRSLREAHRRLP